MAFNAHAWAAMKIEQEALLSQRGQRVGRA